MRRAGDDFPRNFLFLAFKRIIKRHRNPDPADAPGRLFCFLMINQFIRSKEKKRRKKKPQVKVTRTPPPSPDAFVQPTLSDRRCPIIDESRSNGALASVSIGETSKLPRGGF